MPPKYPPGLAPPPGFEQRYVKPIGSERKEKIQREFKQLLNELANNPHYSSDKEMREMVKKLVDSGGQKKRSVRKRRSKKRSTRKRRSKKRSTR